MNIHSVFFQLVAQRRLRRSAARAGVRIPRRGVDI